jgi:hypothetical protein
MGQRVNAYCNLDTCHVQGVVQDARTGNMPESRTVMARLAYLIDLQTIRIMDLLTNATLATINHDTRIDWLVGRTGFKVDCCVLGMPEDGSRI